MDGTARLAEMGANTYRIDVSIRYIDTIRRCPIGGSGMSSGQLYDTIGTTYAATRRTEPRIAAQVWSALGDARTVLNVGAGAGSYEPPDREVTAAEPSAV